MLAYIHIEKAAGQTLIRILENNYIYRHCRVAPLKKEHKGIFKWVDLKLLLMFNPFLQALAGHSIVPHSDLLDHRPDIRFITVLREPIERYISHYQYWVQSLNRQISFEDFLSLEDLKDFQTKKIAGSPDLPTAKKILKENIFLAGVLEEFDEFLMVLKKKLAPQQFDIGYERKNVAKSNHIKNQIYAEFNHHREQIEKNNRFDLELYDYIKKELFQKEKQIWLDGEYGKNPAAPQNGFGLKFKRNFVGKLYRNLYMGLIINIIRKSNGLRIGGSY